MKEADSVVRCRLAWASARLTAAFGTLIAEHSKCLSGYDSLKFSNIVSLLNFGQDKDLISVWLPVFWLVSAASTLLPEVKQALAFIGM